MVRAPCAALLAVSLVQSSKHRVLYHLLLADWSVSFGLIRMASHTFGSGGTQIAPLKRMGMKLCYVLINIPVLSGF